MNRQAGLVAGQCQGAAYLRRYVVVVDDEIDAYDINDVLWAMCNRPDPVYATTGVEKAKRARVLGTRALRDLPTEVEPSCLTKVKLLTEPLMRLGSQIFQLPRPVGDNEAYTD